MNEIEMQELSDGEINEVSGGGIIVVGLAVIAIGGFALGVYNGYKAAQREEQQKK